MPKILLVSFSFFAALAFAHAAPLFDQPVAELHLTNGEVLHNAVAKSFNSVSVLVRYSEGGRTVPYDLFPEEFKSLVLARKPAAHVKDAPKPTPVAIKIDPKKKTDPEPSSKPTGDTANGLILTSVTNGSGFMQAEIYNDNGQPTTLSPSALQATLENGSTVTGTNWVERAETGKPENNPGTVELPPASSTTIKVHFPVPHGSSVAKVTWAQS